MSRRIPRACLAWMALAALAATPALAEPIVPGETVLVSRAIQDITLLPGTPFNGGSTPIVFSGLYGDGTITLFRDQQVGNAINIGRADGQYYGFDPNLGHFVFGRVGTLQQTDFGGSITNIVQDPADPGFATGDPSSLRSGTLTFGGPSFGFTLLDLGGITLYTDPAVPFQFTAPLDGLPPSIGTKLSNSGADVLNVLYNGMVVGTTSNRRIFITPAPEPTSLALFGVAMATIGAGAWARRRRSIA